MLASGICLQIFLDESPPGHLDVLCSARREPDHLSIELYFWSKERTFEKILLNTLRVDDLWSILRVTIVEVTVTIQTLPWADSYLEND